MSDTLQKRVEAKLAEINSNDRHIRMKTKWEKAARDQAPRLEKEPEEMQRMAAAERKVGRVPEQPKRRRLEDAPKRLVESLERKIAEGEAFLKRDADLGKKHRDAETKEMIRQLKSNLNMWRAGLNEAKIGARDPVEWKGHQHH